jgi:adenylate kinase
LLRRDLLRKQIELETPLGLRLSSMLKNGQLVPDSVVNDLVTEELDLLEKSSKGFILDGYPRNLTQAEYLSTIYSCGNNGLTAINISLDRGVTVAKLLGRVQCKTCNRPFNTEHIVDRGFDMPAILPVKDKCPMKSRCEPIYERRADDTPEIIHKRLKDFDDKNCSILDYYTSRNCLRTFDVRRGIKDVDDLWQLMSS